jgi:riboflavin synthase
MFTGLVEQIGIITCLEDRVFGKRLRVSCEKLTDMPALGASISISGCCLTVVSAAQEEDRMLLDFDIVQETLTCTTLGRLRREDSVNLEQAMRADTRLGGHFVQGHVDGVVRAIGSDPLNDGECRIRFSMDGIDTDTIIPKGSITLDGVSLTIADVGEDWFEVVLIPTTLQETTLGKLEIDDVVNIETDILTRTIVQVVRRMQLS